MAASLSGENKRRMSSSNAAAPCMLSRPSAVQTSPAPSPPRTQQTSSASQYAHPSRSCVRFVAVRIQVTSLPLELAPACLLSTTR
ncbi:hypothetical protein BC835DRAFT_996819 [Cytidiella melzeri]|nr:hypothetical protein BC835DRAFT_996819 [Cytidiella melzeri]